MSKFEKILLVILLGSIMGAVELYGGDLFRTLNVSNKSSFLFAIGIMLMFASKRLIDFKGSVIIMAAIAAIFKTASANFYACQVAAIMINGIVFEGTYFYLKNKLESSMAWRSALAPIIAYVSYAAFAFSAVYLLKEIHWAERGLTGIGEYLSSSALIAAITSIITINLGLYVGEWFKRLLTFNKQSEALPYFRAVSIALVIVIWVAGLTL
jgi:hypothetical protein